jgi:4'-phosphopantetheinyl transferase
MTCPSLGCLEDRIDVWRVFLDRPAAELRRLYALLSPDERAKTGRFRFARDRRRFIAARGLLRRILSAYVDTEASRLRFSYGPWGKPSVANPLHEPALEFSLAHSGELALYALGRRRAIGVDVERVIPLIELEQLAALWLSVREQRAWHSLPEAAKLPSFFAAWTRKEAYLKATGQGLSFPPDHLDVLFVPGEPAQIQEIDGDGDEAALWSLRTLVPAPGYVAALFGEGHGWTLRYGDWSESTSDANAF